nr:hypothetical protein Iba_scaffold55580CG0010 [Ipomoea batatas]
MPTAEIECQSDVGWRSEAADRDFSAPPDEDHDYAAADGEYGILPPRNLHARKSSGLASPKRIPVRIIDFDVKRDENRGSPSKTISFNACCTLVRSGVSVR